MNARQVLDELFSAQECQDVVEFQVRGSFGDCNETEPTHFEFGSAKTQCTEPVAQWARRRNGDKYDYSSGYAALTKVDRSRTSYKRESDEYVLVAVPSLAGFLALTGDPDYLAERTVKTSQALVAKYNKSLTSPASEEVLTYNQRETAIPFDATYFTGKDGQQYVSQYVIITSIYSFVSSPENRGKKALLTDVDVQIRLRTNLNAEAVVDKSKLCGEEGFTYDGFAYVTRLMHFVNLLKSDEFKKVHKQAVDFICKQQGKEGDRTGTEVLANLTKPPLGKRQRGKRKSAAPLKVTSSVGECDPPINSDLEDGEIPEKKTADAE